MKWILIISYHLATGQPMTAWLPASSLEACQAMLPTVYSAAVPAGETVNGASCVQLGVYLDWHQEDFQWELPR